MKWSKLLMPTGLLLVIAGLLLIPRNKHEELVKGVIKADSIESVQIAYSPNGSMMNLTYQDIHLSADGSFSWNIDLPEKTSDINIYVDNEIFGVRVEQGKTINVSLTQNKDCKTFDAKFKGDNASVSNYYNAYSQAFDIMKYFSPDPSEEKTIAEYRNILEQEYTALQKKLSSIKDKKEQAYYAKLTDGMYLWTKIRILMDQAENEGKSFKNYPEYVELVNNIDPNDIDNIRTNLIFAWLGGQQKMEPDYASDQTNYYLESIDIVEQKITNPIVMQALKSYIGYNYFTYSNGQGDVEQFWNRYKEFITDEPELLAIYETKFKSIVGTVSGSEVPYNPILSRPDGSTCQLSDLFGQLLYIDVWATWCAPCCKEIPHLEKIVAQYKGNDKVKFVSISVDRNQSAWLKKLENDQPDWEQYILSPEEEQLFMSNWGIGGIPRFIMINKEGRIIQSDAYRPSDDRLIETINTQI